jgi:hypothetical protein
MYHMYHYRTHYPRYDESYRRTPTGKPGRVAADPSRPTEGRRQAASTTVVVCHGR